MTQFTITTNDRAVQAAIRQAANQIVDLTPVMSSIGEYFLVRSRDRFDGEVAPGGAKWRVLARSTILGKQRRGKGSTGAGRSRARSNAAANAILKDTLLLRDTITYQPSAVSVAVGTPQRYGVFHQYGTKNQDGTQRMIARPFLGVDAEDVEEIRAIVSDAILSR